ncbi:hypothetical protein BYT27DRAFT_7209214 [Phlegmacium glaucopus]|nr:hypothetical protein BYT27DRAFT_7209214 [Phlegmacium glaucopus]
MPAAHSSQPRSKSKPIPTTRHSTKNKGATDEEHQETSLPETIPTLPGANIEVSEEPKRKGRGQPPKMASAGQPANNDSTTNVTKTKKSHAKKATQDAGAQEPLPECAAQNTKPAKKSVLHHTSKEVAVARKAQQKALEEKIREAIQKWRRDDNSDEGEGFDFDDVDNLPSSDIKVEPMKNAKRKKAIKLVKGTTWKEIEDLTETLRGGDGGSQEQKKQGSTLGFPTTILPPKDLKCDLSHKNNLIVVIKSPQVHQCIKSQKLKLASEVLDDIKAFFNKDQFGNQLLKIWDYMHWALKPDGPAYYQSCEEGFSLPRIITIFIISNSLYHIRNFAPQFDEKYMVKVEFL